jgi:pimeloyl-ACP methyl ester carboxylesterase
MTKPQPQELLLPIPYGQIAAQAWGPENGKRVLALHGWLDNAGSFSRLAPLLPRFRIVALDLPGHGLSSHRPLGAIYGFADWIPDIADAVDALGWDRFNLIGHSLGGAIAGIFASACHDRVERLVFIEALGPIAAEADELPHRLSLFLEERKKLRAKKLPLYASPEEAASARVKAGDLSQEAAQALLPRGLQQINGGYSWRSDPRLRLPSPHRFTEAQTIACLRAIRCRTLLVRAESGMPLPQELAKTRAEAIAHLEIQFVPGQHHVHLDHPERVSPLLENFLQ